jgi:hypothetical protein
MLVVVWWVWVVFAVANLIDLAVQGRDRESLVAAFILVLVTGIVYVGARRPRIVAGTDALIIVNPLRDHRVGWPAVASVDSADLIRVRCEWPDGQGEPAGRKAIYAWAAGTSRRRQMTAQLRAQRRSRGRFGAAAGGFGAAAGGFGARGRSGGFGGSAGAAEPAPEYTDQVITTLTARAEEARQGAPDAAAEGPVSTWSWPAFAAVAIPAVALLIAALA